MRCSRRKITRSRLAGKLIPFPLMFVETVTALRDVLVLLLGAFVGALASIAIWRLQFREEKRRERAKMLLQAIQLAIHSGTHTRNLIYSKIGGLKAIVDLPGNPVDEVMAIVLIYFEEVYSLTKKLHLQQQDLFSYDINSPNAVEIMHEMGDKMAETATEIVKSLVKIAEREKLAV